MSVVAIVTPLVLLIENAIIASKISILKDAFESGNGNIVDVLANREIISSMMAGVEREDLGITRDVFGSVIVNPVFYDIAQLPLDGITQQDITTMETAVNAYISNNSVAFANLVSCLMNADSKTPECIVAAEHFNNISAQTGGNIETPHGDLYEF